MNFSQIKRKIQKYTYKLSRSTTRDKTNLYQQKLRYYHNLNQFGGDEEEANYYKDLKRNIDMKRETGEQIVEEAKKEEKKLEEQIKKCKFPVEIKGEKLTESEETLKRILGLTGELKAKFKKIAKGEPQKGGCGGVCGLPLLPSTH